MAKGTQDDIGVLYRGLALGPELRGEEPKGQYPKGRIRQVFDIFGAEMNGLMRVNVLFLLFALPLFLVLYLYTNYATNAAILGFNFMGNIGMAYPGGSDDATQGLIAVYHAYQNVLYLTLPALVILSVGAAGCFNCYKKYLWGEKLEKVTKTFFLGVKNHWWKYMLVITVDALLTLALGSTVIYFMELRALGTATAGHWVMLIAVCLVEFLILYINMMLLPLMCELDVSFGKQIKNALIFSLKFAPIGLPLWIICLAPLGIAFVKSGFVSILLGVVMLMFGFIFYGLTFTSFSQMALDNILTPLYKLSQSPKNENRKNKKQGGKQSGGYKPASKAQSAKPAAYNYKKKNGGKK